MRKQRRFVVGDIHGAYRALKQVLELSDFNYEKDLLISLGDVADGWSEVPECFEELLKIKNLAYVMGNHDNWLYQWFVFGDAPYIWTAQGGQATIDAYLRHYKKDGTKIGKRHEKFLSGVPFYYELDGMLFVHGGFAWKYPIKDQLPGDLMWDRHLFTVASMMHKFNVTHPDRAEDVVKSYKEVFIGHTSTSYSDDTLKPVHVSNVWNLDQGGGWEGKLTLMDIDTKKYWQSDRVKNLYPEEKGRR